MLFFSASIVLYHTPVADVERVVTTLRKSPLVKEIFLLDNSEQPTPELESFSATYIFNEHNLGYGAAHNRALQWVMATDIPYHLVLNADISFEPEILQKAIDFLEKNTEIGSLMPKVFYPDGKIQYLCKLLPAPMDLFTRRFLPSGWTKKRKERFELRASGYNRVMNVPYLSGCFMLLRMNALRTVGLFDERFFMYPEDIDLTRRIHKYYKTVFYPEISIVHNHAHDSYKSLRMLWIHTVNIARYFNKWGWFFDRERQEINRRTIEECL